MVVDNKPYKDYKTQNISDLYSYFFERGLDILKANSFLSFITPSLFIKGVKYDKLRDLLKSVTILNIKNLGDGVFEEVKMPTAITFLSNNMILNSKSEIDYFESNDVIKIIENESVKLSEIIKIQRGLEIGKEKTNDIEGISILTGEDVGKYFYLKRKFISEETFVQFKKAEEFNINDRLLIRETGSNITCLFIDENLITNRSLYSIKINEKEDIYSKYILALLNSSLIQYYYVNKFRAETNVFPKIRIIQVKDLPVKEISKEFQQPFIDKVNEILLLKAEDSKTDTQVLEQEIDAMVYELYGLSAEEIDIVEGS
jgi:hypothetical protein